MQPGQILEVSYFSHFVHLPVAAVASHQVLNQPVFFQKFFSFQSNGSPLKHEAYPRRVL